MKPRFQHDCDRCHFLGVSTLGNDLYFCKNRYGGSLISRGHDYGSYPLDVWKRLISEGSVGSECIKEAFSLAIERGLID